MKVFNEILKKYIIQNSSGSFKEGGEGMARVLVKGIPFPIAKNFVEMLVADGGLIIHNRPIPVILCDDKVNSWKKPESDLGGVCGKDHVLNLRNSSQVNEIIVLLGEGSSLDKSNTTSFIPIGIDEDIPDDEWSDHDMIQFFLEKALEGGSLPFYLEDKKQLVINVLKNFKSGNSHQGEHIDQWNLLKEISQIGKTGTLFQICALLGLINEDDASRFEVDRCVPIFSKISDNFENLGIGKSVEEWLEKELDEEIKVALKNFRDHFTSVYDSVSSFKSSPFFYYSSLSWDPQNNDWWKILTVEKWTEILEETVELEGSCSIEITNAVFRNNKPCPIVLDEVDFEISDGGKLEVGKTIQVYQKKRGYEKIANITILDQDKVGYQNTPGFHKTPVFYQFRIEGYRESTQKIISLSTYEPGFIFDIAQIEKVSPLRESKRKGSRNKTWKSNLVLSNAGSHEINFYWDLNRYEFQEGSYWETSFKDSKTKVLDPVIKDGKGGAIFEIEDECDLLIILKNKEDESLNSINLTISTNESEPTGVTNIYDKLVLQNKSSKGLNEKVSVNPSVNHLHQIQKWIIENKDKSYYPILLGTDFKENLKQPNWDGKALITSSDLNLDCRPKAEKFNPPSKLVEIRSNIIQKIIKKNKSASEFMQPLIEYRELYTLDLREELSKLVLEYLKEYQNWLTLDPDNASWFDVIAINDIQGNVLENDPFAILLNPFHPVRLSWQFQSQIILYQALEDRIPCPAAGIFESSQFPDSFALPCYRSQLHFDQKVFLSIDSDTTYWGILWNSEKLGHLRNESVTGIFDKTFGLQIQGLDEGLSSSQVEHTLSDIFKIKSGQNSLNVEVYSESSETELFNQGVSNWVGNNLGEDKIINNKKEVRDIWFSSGSRKLNIFDTRKLHFQPSAEELVDITSDSGYNLKWHSQGNDELYQNLDLTILSHLSNQSPALIKGTTSAVIFNGGISRERIRYSSLNDFDKLSFTESRIYSELNSSPQNDKIGKALSDLILRIEEIVIKNGFGHLNTTPQLKFVKDQLLKADYCAISSSAVDPSAFFDSEGDNLLWDYELPSYSRKQSSQSGFYLLAKKSKIIISAVEKSLSTIPGIGKVSTEIVDNILKEISGRGIPTLKTLASGGASANGEIGMLTAMHLLQNFHKEDESFEFFPVTNKNIFNLLVPIDPFSSQINALYDRLDIEKLRPDLLAFSFCVDNGEVHRIKITPVEIKYRNSQMNTQQLRSALTQCHSFTKFYEKLLTKSSQSLLWDIARCRLLTDMISFSFATYGRRLENQIEKIEWARLQSKLINAFNHQDKIEVSKDGRLLVISSWKVTDFEKVCAQDFEDVLKISFEDAKDILLRKNLEKFSKLGEMVGDWGLMCDCIQGDDIQKTINENTDQLIQEETTGEIGLNDKSPNPNVAALKTTQDATKSENISPVKTSIAEEQEEKIMIENDQNEGIKFIVGTQNGALKSVPYFFHPSNTQLNQLNIGIVGDLGTGKTQLIKALVYNITRQTKQNRGNSPKFLVMDTKRDYDGSGDKESDKNFVKSINAKIIKPHNLPINLFSISNSKGGHPALSKAEFFIDILNKLFGGIGPNQEHNILSAVIDCFEEYGYQPYQDDYSLFIAPTLNDIFNKYEEIIGNKKDAPFSIMYKLVLGRYFEADASKTIDFKDFFNQSVILSLGGVAGNDKNLKMIMIFFLNMYREYMLGVKKSEYIHSEGYQLRKIDSYLLIDEANLIMEYELPVLQDILLKGREFGIGILLSSQYLSHFKKSGTNYMQPLLTWFVHKVPNVSVKELESLGLTHVDEGIVEKIKNFDCHYCLYKSLDAPGVIIKGVPHYLLDQKERDQN